MHQVQDWAEVKRLHCIGKSKQVIAAELGMSRITVYRLVAFEGSPHYERALGLSLLDPFKDPIRGLLD
ncbi:MAG: helix-turn-helix domain-containing protein [Actinobacteria bacterium]|nr:helix-turn-helix domain-containing protein [Actinomycetota bacterium]